MPTLFVIECQHTSLLQLHIALHCGVTVLMIIANYPRTQQQAVIVCGCGNQLLSTTVADWIKKNDKVRNTPEKSSWVKY